MSRTFADSLEAMPWALCYGGKPWSSCQCCWATQSGEGETPEQECRWKGDRTKEEEQKVGGGLGIRKGLLGGKSLSSKTTVLPPLPFPLPITPCANPSRCTSPLSSALSKVTWWKSGACFALHTRPTGELGLCCTCASGSILKARGCVRGSRHLAYARQKWTPVLCEDRPKPNFILSSGSYFNVLL
jgi:hypothetical protein